MLENIKISEKVSDLTKNIIDVVLSAGEIVRNAKKDRPASVSKDGHANFATEYDSRVQAYLMDRLSKLLPESRFLGEEDGQNVFKEEYRKGYLFVIDPIDGTNNFIAGLEPHVVSVGLFKDGEPYIGVVYCPGLGQICYAEKGCGAYRNEDPIHVSAKPLALSLVGFGTSPYVPEYWDETFAMAKAYLPRCVDVRRTGSAAWDLCLFAGGQYGLFFEKSLNIYDYGAGLLIALEAGGHILHMDGSPLKYEAMISAVAYGDGISREELIFSPFA